jgi:hypothetical protein
MIQQSGCDTQEYRKRAVSQCFASNAWDFVAAFDLPPPERNMQDDEARRHKIAGRGASGVVNREWRIT